MNSILKEVMNLTIEWAKEIGNFTTTDHYELIVFLNYRFIMNSIFYTIFSTFTNVQGANALWSS